MSLDNKHNGYVSNSMEVLSQENLNLRELLQKKEQERLMLEIELDNVNKALKEVTNDYNKLKTEVAKEEKSDLS